MLRLNIRCLNNQVRFEPRRLPRGDERENERKRLFKCGREREGRDPRRTRAKEKERERGRSGGGDSGSDRVGIEHVLRRSSFSIRARSSSLPSLHLSYTFSSAPPSPSYTSSDLPKVSSARLPSRRLYAKCIYVLCKASNRRWPREPDAQCVINTDALVVPFPPSSTVPFTYSSSQSTPCLCRSSRASETHRSSQ